MIRGRFHKNSLDCTGCGACVDACIVKQMNVIDGGVTPGEECKACGRCSTACPAGAITITLNDSDYVNACIERIREHVDAGRVACEAAHPGSDDGRGCVIIAR